MWVEITVEDVKSRFARDELESLQQQQVAEGQADPIVELIKETVDMVRGFVGVHNSLGEGDTIPEKLKMPVLNIIRYEALNRLDSEVSESRKLSYEQSFAILKDVKLGSFQISEPETVDADEGQGGVTLVGYRPRISTREQTNGLL